MAYSPLSVTLIAREVVRLVLNAPWDVRGPDAFHAALDITGPPEGFLLTLDAFSRRYLNDAVITAALSNKSPAWGRLMELPAGGLISARETFGDVTVRVITELRPIVQDTRMRIDIECEAPARPDPEELYFWLGQIAEAA